jgi:ribonucleoside-triphosphate reductase (thioredoxin)
MKKESYFPNEMSKFIFYRTYSRWRYDLKRRESWDEAVDRLITFYREVAGDKLPAEDFELIRKYVLHMEVMPSMRLLWTAGEAAKKNNFSTYNCSFVAMDDIVNFGEMLYILMHGAGVGYSVERKSIEKLPTIKEKNGKTHSIVVEDSKEGWMVALNTLCEKMWDGYDVTWDVSKLRPKGAILKTFGGRSSGPEPLVDCFRFFNHIIERHRGRKLSSINVHDMCCKIAEIVVVGGVRRASCISLSDLYDIGMRNSKQGQFWLTHPYRAMANNSAVFDHKPSSVEFMREWLSLAESGTGERGIFNRSKLEQIVPSRRNWEKIRGTNPCGEILLRSRECCNLSEVVIRKEDTVDTLMEKVKVATIMGTIQSMLTNFGDLVSDQWKKNCEEERLLGVSLTGQLDNPEILTGENLQALRDYAVGVNIKWSRKLGIRRSASVTCVKPSGTTSALVDSASGFHPRYAKYYIRRIRINATDPLYQMMKDQGMKFVPEVNQIEKSANTFVCEFPIKAPENAITRNDMTAIEQLEQWMKIKSNWAEHTVSATIYVDETEWLEVGGWVYKNFDKISGLSFLPKNDHVYQLAPYEEITQETYDKMASEMPAIDYGRLSRYEKEDYTEGAKQYACTGDKCELK